MALLARSIKAIFSASMFIELTQGHYDAAFRALFLLRVHARGTIVAKLNKQKTSSHTLNQALAEGADEAFSSSSSNGGAQSAVMMHKEAGIF